MAEASELGVLQLHLSGGEPLLRRDLIEIVRNASGLGLYTNLITSGSGLSPRRAELLRAAGLDHVQISIQADDPILADRIAGTPSFERKQAAARLVKKLGWPLTVNVVLHRHNIDRVDRILDMAADLEADRVELANTQYYGWAWRNRDGLLPSRAQLERAEATVRAARSLLAPDVHVTATHTGPYPPPIDLTGADEYMKGLTAFAEPIVAGSVRELAGVGDDRNALLALDLQAAFDPSGPAVPAPCARLYLVEDGKIKTEQVVFYVSQG